MYLRNCSYGMVYWRKQRARKLAGSKVAKITCVIYWFDSSRQINKMHLSIQIIIKIVKVLYGYSFQPKSYKKGLGLLSRPCDPEPHHAFVDQSAHINKFTIFFFASYKIVVFKISSSSFCLRCWYIFNTCNFFPLHVDRWYIVLVSSSYSWN